MRAAAPVSKVEPWGGSTAWLATRYEDIRHVLLDLLDPQISSDTTRPRFPQASETAATFRSGQRTLNRMDSPRHDVHRMMLAPAFTVRHVREYRPYPDDMIDELFDAMGAPLDMVDSFALVVPARVITRILDLPSEDSEFFLDRVKRSMGLDRTPAEITRAGQDTLDYLARVIDERTGGSGDGLITRLVRDRVMTGQLTSLELQHMLHLLLVGGFDTTANLIALGTLLFLQNPDQIVLLRGSPDLLPNAVEELLRYLSVAHHVAYRQARGTTQIAGHQVRDGDAVVAPLIAANHDPDVFGAPGRFDITRDARPTSPSGTVSTSVSARRSPALSFKRSSASCFIFSRAWPLPHIRSHCGSETPSSTASRPSR